MGKEFIEPKCRKCGFVFEAVDSERKELNGKLYLNCPNCQQPVNRDFHFHIEDEMKISDKVSTKV